jgi:hypothetical protein
MASPQLPQTPQAEPMVDASPLSSKRPVLSSPAKKRKLSDSEAGSPTSTDEVDPASPEEGAISPKKKARAEADPSKWECLTSSVALSAEPKDENDDKLQQQFEPIAFSDAPAELSDEELHILQFFMGA